MAVPRGLEAARGYRQMVTPRSLTHVLPLWLGAGFGDGLGWLVTGDGVGCGDEPGVGVVLWPGVGVVLWPGGGVVLWPGADVATPPGDGEPPTPGVTGVGCGCAACTPGCPRGLAAECVLCPGGATAAGTGSWPPPTWPGCGGRTAMTISVTTSASAAAAAKATG
jgi:hypothetical protein